MTNFFSTLAGSWTDLQKTALEIDQGDPWTFDDVLAGSARFAHALRAANVKPGDRVAVQVEKSPEALLLYLACLRAGAVYLPLNTAYTAAELEYFLRDAEPAAFVCDPSWAEEGKRLCKAVGVPSCLTLGTENNGTLTDKVAACEQAFTNAHRDKSDLAAILYTSGTTGRSKGAMLTHDNLASNARALVDTWHFTSDDVLLHALPIFHVHGLFVAINVSLLSAASMIFLRKFDPAEVCRNLPRATAMMGVPTFYVRLLAEPGLTRELVQHMRLFVSGSAPLLAETHREFEKRTGHSILERYGMTETGMNTSNPYRGQRVAGTVGLPLPGVSVRVSNPETGDVLEPNEIGMIEVKGPNVFKGYWRMPEKTASEFRDGGWFITGDLGKIDQSGYLHILGRGKDLVISGGYNVYPKEIETEIDALDGVIESAVIGVPHSDFGEGVVAIVVTREPGAWTEKAVLATLKPRLAKFKLPKRVIFVDDLPRNTMGKVQKNVLRETYAKIFA